MVRAIIVLTIVVVCSFAFVLLQLLMRAPAAASSSGPAAPMLRGTEDGVISVDLMIQRLEKRVQDGEEQSATLRKDLDDSRTEGEALRQKVTGLEGEVRRLRRQLDQASQPPAQPEANAPRPSPPTVDQPPLTPTDPVPPPN